MTADSLSNQETPCWFVSQAVMQFPLAATPRILLQLSLWHWTNLSVILEMVLH